MKYYIFVRIVGFEPTLIFQNTGLSRVGLPIPPYPHMLYRERDSNPHALWARDFKSLVSTSSTTGAFTVKFWLYIKKVNGWGGEIWTSDLLHVRQLLLPLSYTPIICWTGEFRNPDFCHVIATLCLWVTVQYARFYPSFINVSFLMALLIHLANSEPLISASNLVVPKSSDKLG